MENFGLIALLLCAEADVELRNHCGKTALELADELGKSSLVTSLLRGDTAIQQSCLPVPEAVIPKLRRLQPDGKHGARAPTLKFAASAAS